MVDHQPWTTQLYFKQSHHKKPKQAGMEVSDSRFNPIGHGTPKLFSSKWDLFLTHGSNVDQYEVVICDHIEKKAGVELCQAHVKLEVIVFKM